MTFDWITVGHLVSMYPVRKMPNVVRDITGRHCVLLESLKLYFSSLYWFHLMKLFKVYQQTKTSIKLSRLMTKTTKWHVHPAKTQISLGIRPVWAESSPSAWMKLGSLATHWAHSEDLSLRWAHSHFVFYTCMFNPLVSPIFKQICALSQVHVNW